MLQGPSPSGPLRQRAYVLTHEIRLCLRDLSRVIRPSALRIPQSDYPLRRISFLCPNGPATEPLSAAWATSVPHDASPCTSHPGSGSPTAGEGNFLQKSEEETRLQLFLRAVAGRSQGLSAGMCIQLGSGERTPLSPGALGWGASVSVCSCSGDVCCTALYRSAGRWVRRQLPSPPSGASHVDGWAMSDAGAVGTECLRGPS